MEKDLKSFIKNIFKKFNEYDLYNYLLSSFCDDVSVFSSDSKYDRVVDYLSDSAYEIEMKYYDNKQKMNDDKALDILKSDVIKIKDVTLKMI